jgi:hypothetical protein
VRTRKQSTCTSRKYLVCDAKVVVRMIMLCDQCTRAQLFELLPLLKIVFKGEIWCGATQFEVEHTTSSDTAHTSI